MVPVLGLCGVLGWKGRRLCGIVLWLLSEVFSPFSWVILLHVVLDALPPGRQVKCEFEMKTNACLTGICPDTARDTLLLCNYFWLI